MSRGERAFFLGAFVVMVYDTCTSKRAADEIARMQEAERLARDDRVITIGLLRESQEMLRACTAHLADCSSAVVETKGDQENAAWMARGVCP